MAGGVVLAVAFAVGNAAPIPQPYNGKVFEDDFESDDTYATYTPIGDATVTIGRGLLSVDIPDTSGDHGLSVRVPENGTGIRCFGFTFGDIDEAPLGSSMTWTWWGYDENGKQVEMLRTEVIKSGSFTVRHTKKDGTTVSHHVPGKNWRDVKKKQWDTRRRGKQVQLEIKFKDGSKYSSEWIDPPEGTIAGFDVETDVADFSLDGTGGEEIHADLDAVELEPVEAGVKSVATSSVVDEGPAWLLQVKDADHIVAATVREVHSERVFFEDGEPRIRVDYAMTDSLAGYLFNDTFSVYHGIGELGAGSASPYRTGQSLILFLRQGFELGEHISGNRLWDAGGAQRVLPDTEQNRKAVADRLLVIYGGAGS
ncbi:hypothetical protein ABI59_16495 [Acidobacteria bacterium Mor1]|nr:hypothetical protein ABI59_16495 [Acidobacteria bacterium Mor1]